jgi:hypothetical protein
VFFIRSTIDLRGKLPGAAALAIAAALSSVPVAAASPNDSAKPRPIVVKRGPPMRAENCPSLSNAQAQFLSCTEAVALIEQLKDAQSKVRAGQKIYFELFSGAPALDPMTKVSPRNAFLNMPFEKAFIIRRVETGNRLWQPYKIAVRPTGPGGSIWDIEAVRGFSGEIQQVQLRYGPPPPF